MQKEKRDLKKKKIRSHGITEIAKDSSGFPSCDTVYCPISHELKATRQLNMVRGQVIEYNKICFFKNFAKNEAERVLPDLLLFFKKILDELIVSSLQLSFIIFQ